MSKFPPKPPDNPKSLNLGMQNMHIQQKYSIFSLRREGKNWVWLGFLKPTDKSIRYKVKIVYHPYQPKVFVLEPEVLDFAPHRYGDKSLCLYFPNDKSFDGQKLISDTIIPWTSEWLYFYEVWLEEGVWWGPEAPHSP
ncbi:hypothetical protein [Siminovitchia fordii]|uniref:Type II CBASS E2 protein domain-containing protein n=1 Tax=Siminovitchia fordii TaxID=254759 RepID=A0ABQ4KE40_9BACI|nr:hypothetical protein [Siminovitchia fordii]GIN23390.1 hypothetical protein J1TS3_45240 [Siminovitchia fordii]